MRNNRPLALSLFVLGLLTLPAFGDSPVPTGPANSLGLPSASNSAASGKADEIRTLWSEGKKKEANKMLDEWMTSDKKSAMPWVVAAELQFLQKRFKRTLSLASKALDRNPAQAEAYYWRGQAYEAMKNHLDAENEYRAALLARPEYTLAKDGLSRVEDQLKSPADARGKTSEANP